ncbi:MAG: PHP domain-containing protein [Deltaproteobacteria bacterium]|nr:PHP domain-containing protein [Deltaproteobacteria bacterium]
MEIELHAHTHHSRGSKIPVEVLMSPTDLVREAKRIRLDAVAVTDHSESSGWKEALEAGKRYGVTVIPGIEIKTEEGHLIGLGLNEHIDDGMSVDETVERIKQQGDVSVAPHPFDIRNDGIKNPFKKTDAVEIFNSLGVDRLSNELAEKRAKETSVSMVVGSDAHSKEMLGRSINRVRAHDMDSALKQIKMGHVRWTKSYTPMPVLVSWARDRLLHSYPDVIQYVTTNYSRPKASFSKYFLKRFVMSNNPNWIKFCNFSLWMTRRYSWFKTRTM